MYKNKKTFNGMAKMLDFCYKHKLTQENSVLVPPADFSINGKCIIYYNKQSINL
ncbi:MAG: hypothetical protein LBU83_00235 [Bacteroidales bacterium]|jgi:hypothetical protein|nr:hypothetical protein [Bacteroidales bacterium]